MIDPRISLGVQPVQLNDPLDTYAKVASIKNVLARGRQDEQQAQINTEQLRGLKTKNDETDRLLAEERNLDGILNEAGGDWNKARELAVQRGISAKTVTKIDNTLTEHATKLAQKGEAEFKLAKEKNAFAYDALTSAAALENDPAAQKAEYEARTQEGVIKGLYKPSEIIPYQGPQSVRQMRNRFGVDKNIFDAAAAQRAAAEETRKVETHTLDVANKNADLSDKYMKEAGVFPESDAQSQTADYKNYLKDKGEGFKGTFDTWQNRDANRRRPVVQNFAPGLAPGQQNTKLTGDDFLKTLPSGTAAQIRAIAEGKDEMPSASSRSQAAQSIRDAVFQYDPTFSKQRAQVRKAFTTGPDAKNIGALNTAIVHLGRLGDAAEALNNGTFTPANEVFNYIKDKFGSEATTNFSLLKDAVAGEVAGALKGNATDIEIEKIGKSIRAANSPAQMKGVVQEGLSVLKDKANTYDERFHRENADDPWSPILPAAKDILNRNGIGKSAAPSGSPKATHRFNPATGKAEPI